MLAHVLADQHGAAVADGEAVALIGEAQRRQRDADSAATCASGAVVLGAQHEATLADDPRGAGLRAPAAGARSGRAPAAPAIRGRAGRPARAARRRRAGQQHGAASAGPLQCASFLRQQRLQLAPHARAAASHGSSTGRATRSRRADAALLRFQHRLVLLRERVFDERPERALASRVDREVADAPVPVVACARRFPASQCARSWPARRSRAARPAAWRRHADASAKARTR